MAAKKKTAKKAATRKRATTKPKTTRKPTVAQRNKAVAVAARKLPKGLSQDARARALVAKWPKALGPKLSRATVVRILRANGIRPKR